MKVSIKELTSNFVPGVIAGTVQATLSIVFAVALAALIFAGPLAEYLTQGIGILLLGTVIFAVLSALTATYPLLLSMPQELPVAILALMAVSIGASIGNEMTAAQAYEFIFVAMGLSSILVGLFLFFLGKFRLGKMVRFIPFPVMGGFLAGTGWLIITFSFTMMTDLDLTFSSTLTLFEKNVFYQWFPGLVFALILLMANRRWSHYLLTPGILLGGIVLFYIVMFALGFSYLEMEANGYLLGPFPEGSLFPELPFAYVPEFRWDLLFVHLPAIVTMMVLCAISVLFNYSGLELIVKEDFNLDKELRLTGYGNMLAGFAGTPPGFMDPGATAMSYNLGARSRVPSIVAALICGTTLVFGAQILSIFPKVILGGLLLSLGLGFLVEWLVDTWKKLRKSDYLVVVLILITIGTVGFLEGVVIGLLLSILLFVINYSKVEVVKHELNGKTFKSKVERSENLKQRLEHSGDQIFILSLQGFIFFGTANRLLRRVLERIETDEGLLRYVLLDFSRVTGLDSSAINSFNKLRIAAQKNGFCILLCGLDEDMKHQLRIEGLIPDDSETIQTFMDLDHGSEWCEEQIIQSAQQDLDTVKLEGNNQFRNLLEQLVEYLENKDVPANNIIIEQGKDPGGIFFLESGQITVKLGLDADKQIRLKTMGPGTVVGEVSLYLGSKASASVVADIDCQIKYLSRKNFKRLNMENPEKATGLHTFVVKLLSGRLAESNATIQALTH